MIDHPEAADETVPGFFDFCAERLPGYLANGLNKTEETAGGTGPGVGKQKVWQVFVFKSRAAMDQFLVGGKAGADVGASVSTGSRSGLAAISRRMQRRRYSAAACSFVRSWVIAQTPRRVGAP